MLGMGRAGTQHGLLPGLASRQGSWRHRRRRLRRNGALQGLGRCAWGKPTGSNGRTRTESPNCLGRHTTTTGGTTWCWTPTHTVCTASCVSSGQAFSGSGWPCRGESRIVCGPCRCVSSHAC
ncbi:hypothetical protein H257_10585 [Aphanomyces astaci]|uniref:Uncharacterized protein n=1 Tax=Aphanomyces astaci TaxID=112090 RepID=W4G5M3_APHAT|nr:hypothetical protein H257_10585 [Aphanomyces astaci]ETV74980.1 hypothetical protein H257_10585 [Aphanomyces astaci]|eukprot:XP_009835484.1 hypothetical protein H257_10585 [Aphanomyces astaci]